MKYYDYSVIDLSMLIWICFCIFAGVKDLVVFGLFGSERKSSVVGRFEVLQTHPNHDRKQDHLSIRVGEAVLWPHIERHNIEKEPLKYDMS